jgi:hypothetical protein
VTKDAECTRGVAEMMGHLYRGQLLNEVGPESLVLSVECFLRAEKESSLGAPWCYRITSTDNTLFVLPFRIRVNRYLPPRPPAPVNTGPRTRLDCCRTS